VSSFPTALIDTVYVAGPMTGIPEYNAPAFRRAAQQLRDEGFRVISPVEMDEEDGISLEAEAATGDGWDWARALARDIAVVIRRVDAVVVLPGWTKSRGAFLETETAYALDKPVLRFPDLDAIPYDRHPARSQGRVVPAWTAK
jgi:nucleoside 2-deoxyribosyltransferase